MYNFYVKLEVIRFLKTFVANVAIVGSDVFVNSFFMVAKLVPLSKFKLTDLAREIFFFLVNISDVLLNI